MYKAWLWFPSVLYMSYHCQWGNLTHTLLLTRVLLNTMSQTSVWTGGKVAASTPLWTLVMAETHNDGSSPSTRIRSIWKKLSTIEYSMKQILPLLYPESCRNFVALSTAPIIIVIIVIVLIIGTDGPLFLPGRSWNSPPYPLNYYISCHASLTKTYTWLYRVSLLQFSTGRTGRSTVLNTILKIYCLSL